MDVSVRDIEQVEFHDAWRGYNQAEVDDFLDQVVETVERLIRENDALRARVTDLEYAAQSLRVSEETMKKTLLAAEQTAEQTVAEARAEAERIVAEAGNGLDTRKGEFEASLSSLQGFESETKQRLREFLEGQIRALEALTEHPRAAIAPEPAPVQPREEAVPEASAPAPAHELLADAPVVEVLDPSAEVLVEEAAGPTETDTSLFDFEGAEGSEVQDEGSLDDFRPFDDEAALQGRRRRGLFRRRVDDWA